MNNTEIQELRDSLQHFIQAIQNVNENDFDEHQRIHNQYRELYYVYSQLSDEEIAVYFEAAEIKLIQYFHLGMEYENQFNELLHKVQTDLESTIAFIGSNKGFHLLNSSKKELEDYSEDELRVLFGSLFGIQLSKECVKSLRAEKIATILGYALSGRFEQLKPSLTGLTDAEKLDALRKDIHQQEVCMKYSYKEIDNGLEVGIDFEGRKNANKTKNTVSPKGEPDTCFVNPLTKTVHLGFATANLNTMQQGYAFYKAYISAKTLTELSHFENGAINAWGGYTLKPYMLLNSPFSLESDDYQSGSRFKDMLKQCSVTELKLINQLPWLRVVANCANKEHLEAVIEHDIYMLGCDTSNINMMLHDIRELPQEERIPALREYVLHALTTIVGAVNRNEITFDHGTKLRASIMLDNIMDSTRTILQKSKLPVDEVYYNERIQPLHKGLSQMLENIEASTSSNQSKTDIMTKMASLIDDLESVDYCNRMIKQDRSKPIEHIRYVGTKTHYPMDTVAHNEQFIQGINELNELSLQDALQTLNQVFPRRGHSLIAQFKEYRIHRDADMKKELYINLSNAITELKKRGYAETNNYVLTLRNMRNLLIKDKNFYGVLSNDVSVAFSEKLSAHIALKLELEQFSL